MSKCCAQTHARPWNEGGCEHVSQARDSIFYRRRSQTGIGRGKILENIQRAWHRGIRTASAPSSVSSSNIIMCSVHPAFPLFQMTHRFWIRRAPGNLHTHRMGTHTNTYHQLPPNTQRMPIKRALKYHSNAHHHNDDIDPQIPTFPMPRALPRLPTWPPIPTTTPKYLTTHTHKYPHSQCPVQCQ